MTSSEKRHLAGYRFRWVSAGLVAGVLCLAVLTGCAVRSVNSSSTAAIATSYSPAVRFALSGRFSAKSGTEQVSGQFRYTHTETLRTLNLFSPLGTPMAEIVASQDLATLTQANGGTQTAASLSAMLRTVIDLPVTDAMLSAWLQGLPSLLAVYSARNTELDATGLPTRFTEGGWDILISARMAAGDGKAPAPQRMRWTVTAQPDTEVRWVIDEWSTP